jgi:hypothetical protein
VAADPSEHSVSALAQRCVVVLGFEIVAGYQDQATIDGSAHHRRQLGKLSNQANSSRLRHSRARQKSTDFVAVREARPAGVSDISDWFGTERS